MKGVSIKKISWYFRLIRFNHTIFAMPFALLGTALAYTHAPKYFTWKKFFYIIGCMVLARTAAMAFNRYLDRDIDKLNPRTQNREIPTNKITPNEALGLTIVSAILFSMSAWFLNPLCFYLSPLALLVILGYSYTKRFTWLCHIILGIGLALAPIGAYLAITGYLHYTIVLISVAVLLWVSGFDIIYALQDEEFDKAHRLYSIPAALGKRKALFWARLLHAMSSILLLVNYIGSDFGNIYLTGWMIFSILLWYEHYLVSPNDLSKVPFAFGVLNCWAGLIFGIMGVWDLVSK